MEPQDGLGGDVGDGWMVVGGLDGSCVSAAAELAPNLWRMGAGDCGNPASGERRSMTSMSFGGGIQLDEKF
jgi:hypothetical protein